MFIPSQVNLGLNLKEWQINSQRRFLSYRQNATTDYFLHKEPNKESNNLDLKQWILVIFRVEIYSRKSRKNGSENESIGNKSTHNSSAPSKIILYGETNLWEMIRHMFVVRKSLLRPPGMLLKYTKCLLLHLLTFCVLCVVYDTSLPQTSW